MAAGRCVRKATTLTAHALAWRTAEQLINYWKTIITSQPIGL